MLLSDENMEAMLKTLPQTALERIVMLAEKEIESRKAPTTPSTSSSVQEEVKFTERVECIVS